MSAFDLLFIFLVLASIVALTVAAVSAIRGRSPRALTILRVTGVCAAIYFAAAFAVALLRPQRVMPVGDPWCFDEWCLTVERVSRTPRPPGMSYKVDFRIFSALAASASARVERGSFSSMIAAASILPIRMHPPSLSMSRSSRRNPSRLHVFFACRPSVRGLGLITGHGGSYCGAMSLLIIGERGCLFHKPTMIRIQ